MLRSLRPRRRLLPVIGSILAIAFPWLRLWPLNGQFYRDWSNHEWLAAYAGEHLRHHGTLPAVINTAAQAGMPYPIFYGSLFEPLLALWTAWCSPGLALRLVVVAVTALQLRLVSRALVDVGAPLARARGAACLVIWAIYPLTNVYHRAAIPEYVATGLLTCAAALWFSMVQARTANGRRRRAGELGLALALMAGTHPITALYALPTLALLLATTLVASRRELAFCEALVKALLIPAALVAVTIAPWAYALAKFERHLQITSECRVDFYAGIDAWATRFSPLPSDPRTIGAPLENVGAPYLDAQVNVALAALVVGWFAILAWRQRSSAWASLRALAPCVAAFALFTWMSVSPAAFEILPPVAKRIQIAYRAISFANLALLLALLWLAAAARPQGESRAGRRASALVLGAALALSAAGVAIKWVHASKTIEIRGPSHPWSDASERREWAGLPREFYGADAYATPSLYRPLDSAESARKQVATIPIGTDAAFGVPQPLRLDVAADGWFVTNVQAFTWNELIVDGATVPGVELRADGVQLAVHVAAGRHTLELRTAPDPFWLAARAASLAVILLWSSWVLFAREWTRRFSRQVSLDHVEAGNSSREAKEWADRERSA